MSPNLKKTLEALDILRGAKDDDLVLESVMDEADRAWLRLTDAERYYANMYSRFLHCMDGYEYHAPEKKR